MLKVEIITPEAVTYSDDVDMVTLPGIEGEMGIFPNHVPLLTQVVPGEIVVRKGGEEILLAVGEGFAEITGERVAILTDMAIRSDNIDEAAVEEARRRADGAYIGQNVRASPHFASAETRTFSGPGRQISKPGSGRRLV